MKIKVSNIFKVIIVFCLAITFTVSVICCKETRPVEEQTVEKQEEEKEQETITSETNEANQQIEEINLDLTPVLLSDYYIDFPESDELHNSGNLYLFDNKIFFVLYYINKEDVTINKSELKIIDAYDKKNLKEVGSIESEKLWWSLLGIEGDYLYIISQEGFHIVDIKDIGSPYILSSCINLKPISGMNNLIKDDYAYSGPPCLQIIDITNKENPETIGSISSDEGFWSINFFDVSGDYVYVSYYDSDKDDYSFSVVDIKDKREPKNLGSVWLNKNLSPDIISINQGYAYLESGIGDLENPINYLQIIDIKNKKNPFITGNLELSEISSMLDPIKDGDFIYMADRGGGLYIIDVEEPSNPKIIETIETGRLNYFYVEDNIGYIADKDKGLIILDLSQIENPREIGICDSPGYENFIIRQDNILFIKYQEYRIGIQAYELY